MTPQEAESYKTWAANKGVKQEFAVTTTQTPTAIVTSVRKAKGGFTYSETFSTPLDKPKAEAEDHFLQACKKVDSVMNKAARK